MFESLARLTEFMASNGAIRILAKRLSPNDNSKNQVYLGSGPINFLADHSIH